ncbi:MAG: 4'-phosphopantetheinyl transferase superfamily protein [Bacillota bacterium]|nr:4'-phosphopantetheinyl transferase superfamily protein [Bacillota bacterium]
MESKKIVHLGIDTESISRIDKLFRKLDKYFLDRLYTYEEQKLCLNKLSSEIYLARNFSMKEAVSKLLGTGFKKVEWNEIAIYEDKDNDTVVSLQGKALECFNESLSKKIHCTYSIWDDEVLTIVISE